MKLASAAVSGVGRVRDVNQDNFYLNGQWNRCIPQVDPIELRGEAADEGFFAVADGMGGESAGEQAALTAVSALDRLDRSRGVRGVMAYLQDRNAEICDWIRQNGGRRSGTTFVGLNLRGSTAEMVNIGDSRAYLLRDGALSQLSVDHTALRPMVEMGILSAEKARRHPDRHKLSQHLGIFPDEMLIEPYSAVLPLREGDLFLLCSDGLYDMVEDADICRILRETAPLDRAAAALYDAAMAAGGRDNVTVLLIQVQTNEK